MMNNMEFNKSTGGGAWLDKSTLTDGTKMKIVSEAVEAEGKNGTQIVAKVRLAGGGEPSNISINAPSKNALIDAFGKDSVNWVDKELTIKVEKTRIGGKLGHALYLIPEGFEAKDDDSGFLVIKKKDTTSPDENGEVTDMSDIPF